MYQVEHMEENPVDIVEDSNHLHSSSDHLLSPSNHLLSPSDSDLPSWASPKEDESPMAECKVSKFSFCQNQYVP